MQLDIDAAVRQLLAEMEICAHDAQKGVGTEATGYALPEMGPFECDDCVHASENGTRCDHEKVIADVDVPKTSDQKLAIIQPKACCNLFHPVDKGLEAYGTSEGVTKAWDTRGRGRHEQLEIHEQSGEEEGKGWKWFYGVDQKTGIPAARILVSPEDGNRWAVRLVQVDDEYQGRGLGTRMYQHAIGYARKQGATELTSDPEGGSRKSVAHIWRKLGATETPGVGEKAGKTRWRLKLAAGAELDAALDELLADALFHGLEIIGFSKPEEEMVRATASRVPPELMANVRRIVAAPELNAKHGRFDPETRTVNINPKLFQLRQRFGRGPGWIHHVELTMVHEFMHSVYTFLPEEKKDEWRDLSGWMHGWQEGQAPAYEEKRPGWEHKKSDMTHRKGVRFTRHYAERNDDEDFADSAAFLILGKGHHVGQKKKEFIDCLFKTMVQGYPSFSIESPDKAYGEMELPEAYQKREVAAYGTSEGVTKSWDTRGRGRKVQFTANPRAEDLKTGESIHVIAYHNTDTELQFGRRGIFFSEAPTLDYGEKTFRAEVTMKNPLVVSQQPEAVQKLFDGEQLKRVQEQMDRWESLKVYPSDNPDQYLGGVDLPIALQAQKKGYDGIVYTDPEVLSRLEFQVFSRDNFRITEQLPDGEKGYKEYQHKYATEHAAEEARYAEKRKTSGWNPAGPAIHALDVDAAVAELLAGGPGSGCNPAVAEPRCGRPSGEVEKAQLGDVKELKSWMDEVPLRIGKKKTELQVRQIAAADLADEIGNNITMTKAGTLQGPEKFKSDYFVLRDQAHGILGAVAMRSRSGIPGEEMEQESMAEVAYLTTNPKVMSGEIEAHGVGTRLMVQAAKYAAELGKGLELHALTGAREFYKKLGMHSATEGSSVFWWTKPEVEAIAKWGHV